MVPANTSAVVGTAEVEATVVVAGMDVESCNLMDKKDPINL